MLSLPKDTSIAAVLAVSDFPADDFLLLLTRQGTIKKTPLQAFQDIRANGICAIRLNVRYPFPSQAVLQALGNPSGCCCCFFPGDALAPLPGCTCAASRDARASLCHGVAVSSVVGVGCAMSVTGWSWLCAGCLWLLSPCCPVFV